jgi:hypothetical protein
LCCRWRRMRAEAQVLRRKPEDGGRIAIGGAEECRA